MCERYSKLITFLIKWSVTDREARSDMAEAKANLLRATTPQIFFQFVNTNIILEIEEKSWLS